MQTTELNKIAVLLERIEQLLVTTAIEERWAVIALLHSQTTTLACAELRTMRESALKSLSESRQTEVSPAPAIAPEEPRYLTEREVAHRLRVSVGMLRKWRIAKKGPRFVKVGRLVRYARRDEDAFLP
jgi:excisionase family DNA binding protein